MKKEIRLTSPRMQVRSIIQGDVDLLRALEVANTARFSLYISTQEANADSLKFWKQKALDYLEEFTRGTSIRQNQIVVDDENLSTIEKVLDIDLMLLTVQQLKKLHVRVTAAYFFKNSNDSKMSAVKLAEDRTFLSPKVYLNSVLPGEAVEKDYYLEKRECTTIVGLFRRKLCPLFMRLHSM